MAKLITVYWRDIPAQIIAKERRDSVKIKLSERFSDAIDRAAMRAGVIGSDAYLEEWSRVSVNCGDDLRAEAQAAAEKIEAAYDKDRLMALILNKGDEPNKK
ncbi:virulence factor [Candidatus Spongiihabitans sp.]|uniref:virulence factor n=1 Tax=Candidatus Spongiihabitans sp. TaxID=3101308 RepID=UPI003C7D1BC2